MIINKQGEKCLCSNGVEYIIGEEVIGRKMVIMRTYR